MHIKNVNVSKLHQEFEDNRISAHPVFDNGDGSGDFTFSEGTDMTLVQQIIGAQDPTPLPTLPTAEERITELENMILMMMEVM